MKKFKAPPVSTKGRMESFFRPMQPAMHGKGVAAAGTSTGPEGSEAAKPLTPDEEALLKVWDLIIGTEASVWRQQLVDDHLDPATLTALFRTCKAARDSLITRLRAVHIDDTVTDNKLNKLIAHLGTGTPADWAVPQLHVGDLQLEQFHYIEPRWRCLQTGRLRVSAVARMPYAAGMEIRLHGTQKDDCGGAVVCDVVASTNRLQEARLSVGDISPDNPEVCVGIVPGENVRVRDQPAALRLGLRLLRTVRVPEGMDVDCGLSLSGWTMTAQLIHALDELPQWLTSMYFQDLKWLPQIGPSEAYATLLGRLPRSVGMILLARGGTRHPRGCDSDDEESPGMLSDRQMIDILLGAPRDRSPEEHLEIQLPNKLDRNEVRDAVDEAMMDDSYPNYSVLTTWCS